MNEPFLFLGIGSHMSVLVIHSILAMIITLVVAKMATRNLQTVPKGCQNVMLNMGGPPSKAKYSCQTDSAQVP
jgi:F0F1-type ATP synthase membrane subunit a